MSNEKNNQNKSGELKKPPYVTRTNQPWTTVFAEDLNKKKEEDTPAETKLDLSQFVKVEKVQEDKSTTIPAPVSETKKDKADTVNKGNVQNVTPIPTPEHKFRPKDSSQQSKPSDEFETKPVMEAAPAATEEKPVAKPESNQQDDDSDSFVSPSFRFLYKGIIIKHNKTEPTYTKTSLFLCEKRRFFMARTEKGVVTTI